MPKSGRLDTNRTILVFFCKLGAFGTSVAIAVRRIGQTHFPRTQLGPLDDIRSATVALIARQFGRVGKPVAARQDRLPGGREQDSQGETRQQMATA